MSWLAEPFDSDAGFLRVDCNVVDQIERIRVKLEDAARLPRQSQKAYSIDKNVHDFFRFFGADYHEFRMNPPASARQIEDWELRHRASLPAPYRSFLEQVGNGGAGPYYGLLPLERWSDGCSVVGEALEAYPSSPCLLRERFPDDPDREAWLVEVGGPDWKDRFNADVWEPMAGSLTLCEVGCGGYVYLILNGPLMGRVCVQEHLFKPSFWHQLNFLDWYEGWLDWVLTGDPKPFHGDPADKARAK
jgi:hypothetical protein